MNEIIVTYKWRKSSITTVDMSHSTSLFSPSYTIIFI